MNSIAISPKFQIVIPKSVRELLHLFPGQKVQVIPYDGRVEVIPERNLAEMRGFLKGLDTSLEREGDRF
jgi:AbrB family looped-hinge helix DNA binding protein